MDEREHRLLNDFQRGFPLCEAPYAVVAKALHVTEDWVLGTMRRLAAEGIVSRVGGVFRPGSVGASTLATIAVPPARLAAVARVVSAHRGVNHNYEREHRFNLWFVANAADHAELDALLARIERETVLRVHALPLVREYHIDLGFDLDGVAPKMQAVRSGIARPLHLDAAERRIVAALQEGLALSPRPYLALSELAGLAGDDGERRVLARLRTWLDEGTLKRLGIIVRHRPLGFTANAMAVWDVPDDAVDAAGERLARVPGVSLCYRRLRSLPAWPYNLFCMIHGRERRVVDAKLDAIAGEQQLGGHPHARLYSRTAFKQRGALHFDAVTQDG